MKKLGDMVFVMAQPIAKAIDAVAGTDIQHCGSCKGRRQALNDFSDDVYDFFHGKSKEKQQERKDTCSSESK